VVDEEPLLDLAASLGDAGLDAIDVVATFTPSATARSWLYSATRFWWK